MLETLYNIEFKIKNQMLETEPATQGLSAETLEEFPWTFLPHLRRNYGNSSAWQLIRVDSAGWHERCGRDIETEQG